MAKTIKKAIVCIFAHPDDEAFGPSGTINKLSQEYDVYLLCATKGQAGKDSRTNRKTSLTSKRAQELRESAKILGIKKVYFLGFTDGTLSNNLYHKLAAKVQARLELLKPEIVLTQENRGVSGHIDHIVVSMVTTYVVKKLPFVKELWYTVVSKERAARMQDYFIYFPPGYDKSEVDKVVDVSDVWDVKVKAMMCHESQKHDAQRILKSAENYPKEEYFLVNTLPLA